MLFYITGPDTHRALDKLNELKEKFLRDVDPSGLSVSTVDGSILVGANLSGVFETGSLFGRRRFIVVRNLLKSKDKTIADTTKALLGNHGKTAKTAEENLIVFFEDEEPAAKSPLHTWLKAHAHTQHFPLLSGRTLEAWVMAELKKQHRQIEPAALRLLIERVGADTWSLSRELARLSNYLEPEAPVTTSVVESLIRPSLEEEIFPLIDAILAGDLRRSAPMLVGYLDQGENVQALVALLETQLRTLIVLAENPRATPSGVHPFVIKKLSPLARRYRPDDLKKIYERLADLDMQLKTTSDDPTTLLLSLLTHLTPQAV